jgi:hypothetical protein
MDVEPNEVLQMPAVFDRDAMAAAYAKRHKSLDEAITAIYHLPIGAPADEIRLLEVNRGILSIADPEPIDFGVAVGTDDAHRLVVLDVTPKQWKEIQDGSRLLPAGWKLEGSQKLTGARSRRR